MSLIAFHRVLIAVGVLFCGGFAVWELLRFLDGRGWTSLLLALAFAVAAAALGYYLRHLRRFLGLDEARGPGAKPPRV